MTELRIINAIVLSTYSDQIWGISYLKVLTDTTLESIKLPSSLQNSKFQHMLKPNNLLSLELIKTQKNWILKSVLSVKPYCNLHTFTDYLHFTQAIKSLESNLKESQETDSLLNFLLNYLPTNLQTFSLSDFEIKLFKELGFGAKNVSKK